MKIFRPGLGMIDDSPDAPAPAPKAVNQPALLNVEAAMAAAAARHTHILPAPPQKPLIDSHPEPKV